MFVSNNIYVIKLQCFGHLMRRVDSLEKTLMLGGIGGRRRRGLRGWDGWMASPTRWTWLWVNSGSWWWTRRAGMLQFMGSQRVRHDWATELNWTESIPWFTSWNLCEFGPFSQEKKPRVLIMLYTKDYYEYKLGLHTWFEGWTSINWAYLILWPPLQRGQWDELLEVSAIWSFDDEVTA